MTADWSLLHVDVPSGSGHYMLISFACPKCGSELEVDAEEAGTRVDCPACSEEIRTPLPRVLPGTTLGGFRIECRIGGGAMGEVFLARQLSMDRMVALKVLPQALTRKPHIVERFRHEVRMSARMEHPHVVTAFEAGEDFGYHFLAMSYVDGQDLGSILKNDGPLTEKQALTYVRQVADALCYAWNNFQMLHRDVKPSNIMVDQQGKARLLDLGISKSLAEDGATEAELTVSGMLVGTPHYMSPEQARSDTEVDSRTDIYSLGATLYHLLTGATPYQGKTTVEVIRQLGVEPVRPIREIQPAVTEHCARLVEKMMAFDLSRRPARWESVLTDIDRVLSGRDPLLPVGESRRHAGTGDGQRPATGAERTRKARADAQAGRTVPAAAADVTGPAPFRPHAPPRIDLRKRRLSWGLARLVRRTVLLFALLVLVAVVAVLARKSGIDDMLRDRLARWLAAESQVTDPAFEDGERLARSVRNHSTPDRADSPSPAPSETPPFEGFDEWSGPSPGGGSAGAPSGTEENTVDDGLNQQRAAREIARVADLAVEEMIKERAKNAEAILRRAARDEKLAAFATEFYRAAAVAGQAGREEQLFLQSLNEKVGARVTLQLENGPTRVKILRVERDDILVLRLHEDGDTPLGRARIPLDDISFEERLRHLRQFEETGYGDVVLTVLLARHGRRKEAMKVAERLPPMLREAFLRRLKQSPPSRQPPPSSP